MSEYRYRSRRVLPPLVVVGAWIVCQPAVNAAVPDNACALLTDAQVSAALGVAVDAGFHAVAGDSTMCYWREKGKPEGPARAAIANLITAQEFERVQKKMSKSPDAQASGIGDEAYFFKPRRLPLNLSVHKGAIYFRISARSGVSPAKDGAPPPTGVPPDDSAKDMAIDKALSAEILKKL